MAATISVLTNWFKRGVKNGDQFMIIVCDTFDHEDYPVYTSSENFQEKYDDHRKAEMQSIMEVYDLSKSMEEQMAQKRVFNGPEGFKR